MIVVSIMCKIFWSTHDQILVTLVITKTKFLLLYMSPLKGQVYLSFRVHHVHKHVICGYACIDEFDTCAVRHQVDSVDISFFRAWRKLHCAGGAWTQTADCTIALRNNIYKTRIKRSKHSKHKSPWSLMYDITLTSCFSIDINIFRIAAHFKALHWVFKSSSV